MLLNNEIDPKDELIKRLLEENKMLKQNNFNRDFDIKRFLELDEQSRLKVLPPRLHQEHIESRKRLIDYYIPKSGDPLAANGENGKYSYVRSYHGRAEHMPKEYKEYFESTNQEFKENEMVDIDCYAIVEIRNRWTSR